MFCPEGYLSFMEARQYLYRLMRAYIPELLKYREGSALGSDDEKAAEDCRRPSGRELEDWFFQEFIRSCRSLCVASPEGVVMRIHPAVASAESTDFDFMDDNPYLYIDQRTWTLDIDRHLKLIEMAGPVFDEKFGEDFLDTASEERLSFENPEIWEYMALRRINRSTELARVIRPFHGWALCMDPEDLPEDISFLPEFSSAEDEADPSPRSVGRKRHLRDAVLSAYLAIYSDGHDGTSLGIVHRRVKEQVGREFSRETLERAIEEAKCIRRMQAERLQKPN